jgi:RND family efflux transporter MFP subunit
MRLTKKYLQPSELRRAKAKLTSVKQELKIAREQLKNSVVLAPSDGVVVYKQIYVGTEFRVVRIGDSIFPNQPFIMLPDMSNLEVHLHVPEVELAMIQKGKDVFIRPLAYPEVRLPGLVETIGSMAQNLPDKPGWQKFFHVVIDLKDFDSRLKPGMSVTAHILSYYNPQTILVPRTTVWWEVEKPFAKVLTDSYQETRELKLGMANEEYYEVLEGLKPGDEVIIE